MIADPSSKWSMKAWFGLMALLSTQWSPGILGHNYAYLLIAVCFVAMVANIVFFREFPYRIVALFLMVPALYIFGVSSIGGVGHAASDLILYLLFCLFLFSMPAQPTNQPFAKAFVDIMVLVAVGAAVTLVFRYPTVLNSPGDIQVEIKHYGVDAQFYYPSALFYPQRYKFEFFDANLPRLMGIFREPGLCQAFFGSALIQSVGVYRGKWLFFVVVSLFIGLLMTLSTAGIVSGALAIAFMPLMWHQGKTKLKLLLFAISVGLLCLLYPFLRDAKAVGFDEKLGGISGLDRIIALENFKSFLDTDILTMIFGVVPMGNSSFVESGAGTVFVFITRFGILGFLFSLVPYIYVILSRQNVSRALLVASPLLVAGFSQPIHGAPIVLLIFFHASTKRDRQRPACNGGKAPSLSRTRHSDRSFHSDKV